MNQYEFEKRFLPALLARFPDVYSWLSKAAEDIGLASGAISSSWFEDHFRYLPCDACIKAVQIATQHEDLQPKRAERWPAAIRKIIESYNLVPRKADSTGHRCELCRDGYVTVYALETLDGQRRGLSSDLVAIVICKCSRGDELATATRTRRGKRGREVETFDAAVHVLPRNVPWRRYGMTEREWSARHEDTSHQRAAGATATGILESWAAQQRSHPSHARKAELEAQERQIRGEVIDRRLAASASYRGGAAEDGL